MKTFFKKHKTLWIVLGVIVVLVGGIIGALNYIGQKALQAMEAVTKIETAYVENREIVSSVAANGVIVAADDKDVSVNLTGVEFLTVDVEVGDVVQEGDLICTFDTENLEKKLADAEKSLKVEQATSNLSISASQRMLSEAEVSRDIAAEEADINIANAWNDYMRALTDVEEAEKDYNEALSDYESVSGHIDSLESAELWFEYTKDEMSAYMSEHNITFKAPTMSLGGIAIGVADWCYVTSEHLTKIGGDDLSSAESDRMNEYLNSLRWLHYYYTSYIDGGTTVSTGTASTVLNSTESIKKSSKNAYEGAVTAAQNKLRAYEELVRRKTSTENSSNSTVAAQEEALKKNQLAASTTGLTTQQTIDSYTEQIEKCVVYAPMSGTVTKVNFSEGNAYNGTAIVTIEDESSYQVSAEIDEYDIGKVKVGQKVVIKTNGTDDAELEGRVAEIAVHATAKTATTQSSKTTYNVKIDILEKNELLKLDMTAKVSIIIEDIPDAVTVPFDAVQVDDEGRDFVEVIDDSVVDETEEDTKKPAFGKKNNADVLAQPNTRRVYVTRGVESDYYIEVFSDELKLGDEVKVVTQEAKSLEQLMMEMGGMGGF